MGKQPTIPTLTQVNYKQWQGIMSDYALIRGHPNILNQEPPQHPSDPDGYAILQAQMRLTILSSIDASIMARIPDDITTQAPYFIMRQISALFQADKSPEEHEFLRSKAKSLTMQPDVVLWMRAPERVTRVRVASTAWAHIRTWPRGPVGMNAPVYH